MRQIVGSRFLAGAMSLILLNPAFVLPVWGQGATGFTSPQAVLVGYFDTIVSPALEGRSLSDATMESFYMTGLASQTRLQIGEAQFTAYWRQVSKQSERPGYVRNLKYAIGQTIYSETADQAIMPATITLEYKPSGGLQLMTIFLNIFVGLGCAVAGESCTPLEVRNEASSSEVIHRTVNEDGSWKLILSNTLISEIQKVAVTVTAKRYAPNSSAAAGPLIIRVLEVTLNKEGTTLRLALENRGEGELHVVNALSLATLTDDSGKSYDARLLRSTLVDTVMPGSSAQVTLVFEPVPLETKRLALSLAALEIGGQMVPLQVDVLATPRPVAPTPIPGEPVFMYLFTFWSQLRRTEERLRSVYRVHVAQQSRDQVTEAEFVGYAGKTLVDAWGRRLGPGRWWPQDFVIGDPVYTPSRDQASIQVTTRWWQPQFLGPNKTLTDVVTFQVTKEEQVWRLILPPEVVAAVQAGRPPVPTRRFTPGSAITAERLTLRLREAILENDAAILQLTIENANDSSVDLTGAIFAATLTDERGSIYNIRVLRSTFPETVDANSPATLILVFEPLPHEIKQAVLTLPDLRLVERVFTMRLNIPFGP